MKQKYLAQLRFLLANLPKTLIKFTLIDRLLTKNVSEVIDTIFRFCGQKKQLFFAIE